jgi:hypothetical protein
MANCENEFCNRPFQRIKDWQRFCSPRCKEQWRYHLRKLEQKAEAELARELREARTPLSEIMQQANGANGAEVERKPLSEILETLKERAEPQQPLPSLRRSWGQG